MALLEVGAGKAYAAIQNAITAASNGDHVRVADPAAGLDYAEDLVVNNKRVRLTGQGETATGPRIGVTGTGGASPALLVSGTGGVFLANLRFSNHGSVATYVVELNVAEDWISRCAIDGDGDKRCLQAQFGDNCLVWNGTYGVYPSCPGQNLFFHFTAVNHTVAGIQCNVSVGELVACLGYNCAGSAFVNAAPAYSMELFSDQYSGTGIPGSVSGMTLADIAFVNYAGNDFRLLTTSQAWRPGVPIVALDLTGNRRLRDNGRDPRVYGGCYDPWPAAPVWLAGGSNVRIF